ncbi:MAG: hypothetical protein OES09_09880 [Gammaproteobacteria bacterium]|nr:hypothetical protein [Gammaproteobacteria bacterium]
MWNLKAELALVLEFAGVVDGDQPAHRRIWTACDLESVPSKAGISYLGGR